MWSAAAYDGDAGVEEDVTAVLLQVGRARLYGRGVQSDRSRGHDSCSPVVVVVWWWCWWYGMWSTQECQRMMQDVKERLVQCEQRRSWPAAAANPGQPALASHRLRLADLWLRGQLMALQALAEYLLRAIE